MSSFRTLDHADLAGRRALVRVDLNIPMEDGRPADVTRIERVLPTIREISGKGGKVILLSHLGRPKAAPEPEFSLAPIAATLARLLGEPVAFADDCIGPRTPAAVAALQDGDVLLLENTRFHPGEEANDAAFIAALASLGDIFVNDAFSAAHRAHASTEGLARALPAFVGRGMQAELEALQQALEAPARPLAAIVGGAKVSTKLALLDNLVTKVDILIIGGGMANTFLLALGKEVGKSLCEKALVATAREIIATARRAKCEIVLPLDAVVAREFKANAPAHVVSVDQVGVDDMILDIGPRSVAEVERVLTVARTLVWNGPFGAFELTPFDAGTNAVAKVAADLTDSGKLVSIGGGGDTVSALNRAGVAEHFSYLSTAGGAFLEWLEGKALPGVEALKQH